MYTKHIIDIHNVIVISILNIGFHTLMNKHICVIETNGFELCIVLISGAREDDWGVGCEGVRRDSGEEGVEGGTDTPGHSPGEYFKK